MHSRLYLDDIPYQIDFNTPLPIGIPLHPFGRNPRCFHAPPLRAKPVEYSNKEVSVEAGASVNFYSVRIVPHGHGTHTESIGHIRKEMDRVDEIITNPFCVATLISVELTEKGDDLIIVEDAVKDRIDSRADALIIRTLPNDNSKKSRDYSGTNPPYLAEEAMVCIAQSGIRHLLIDLPSVDREEDGGKVVNHKIFWDLHGSTPRTDRTITEMVFVPDHIEDGHYVLALNVSNLALDAAPSMPVLYWIVKTGE